MLATADTSWPAASAVTSFITARNSRAVDADGSASIAAANVTANVGSQPSRCPSGTRPTTARTAARFAPAAAAPPSPTAGRNR